METRCISILCFICSVDSTFFLSFLTCSSIAVETPKQLNWSWQSLLSIFNGTHWWYTRLPKGTPKGPRADQFKWLIFGMYSNVKITKRRMRKRAVSWTLGIIDLIRTFINQIKKKSLEVYLRQKGRLKPGQQINFQIQISSLGGGIQVWNKKCQHYTECKFFCFFFTLTFCTISKVKVNR